MGRTTTINTSDGFTTVLIGVALLLVSGCMSTEVEVSEEARFPIPLVNKLPVSVGVHLSDELLGFVHKEDLGDNGSFSIDIGDAQTPMFTNLFVGMFDDVRMISDPTHPDQPVAGTLVPKIAEMQFSTPFQTRTDYFEVWIRYEFDLYSRDGQLLGNWDLSAYGKANTQNYGLNTTPPTLRAAALQACRDAMAAFTVEFLGQPPVRTWLTAELQGGAS